jgi:hypothetical protein
MKKLYAQYEMENEEFEPKDDVLYIDKNDRRISIDMMLSTKSEKVAYKRFRKALIQAQENGEFGDYDLITDTWIVPSEEYDGKDNCPWLNRWMPESEYHTAYQQYGYFAGIEIIDDGLYYIWLNVSKSRMTI